MGKQGIDKGMIRLYLKNKAVRKHGIRRIIMKLRLSLNLFFLLFMAIWGSVIRIRNKNKGFAYYSSGTLKQDKEHFNIVIGDEGIGI